MPDLISHNSTRILIGISKLEGNILFNQKDYNIINDSWVFPKMLKGVPTEIAVRFSSVVKEFLELLIWLLIIAD